MAFDSNTFENIYEIIMEVKDIPENSNVRKITGEKIYKLVSGLPIKIYDKRIVQFLSMKLNEGFETISFDQWMYLYRLNGRVFENDKPFVWCGNVAFRPSLLKKYTLTQIRDNLRGKNDETHFHFKSGNHFTSIGTNEQILEKFQHWGHWSEIPERTLQYVEKCVESGTHFHPGYNNLKIIYQKNLDFLPDNVVYCNKINEKYEHLIKE